VAKGLERRLKAHSIDYRPLVNLRACVFTHFCTRLSLQKLITDLDMRNGHKRGVRVGFININDMYNNDVGKGVVYTTRISSPALLKKSSSENWRDDLATVERALRCLIFIILNKRLP
jgi:hypothetical protein